MLKQLKRIKVRKPSFRRRISTVFIAFELNRHEPMVIKTARTSSAASNKYMILKLFKKQDKSTRRKYSKVMQPFNQTLTGLCR